MIRFGYAGAAAGVLLALALTGCASPTPAGRAGERTPSATSTPTESPTPTGAATLTIGPDGIGALVPGATVPIGGAGIVRANPAGCNTDDSWGTWVAVEPASKFVVATKDGKQYGPINSLGVFDSSVSTAAGVHAGDTTAQLLAAYPHFDVTVSNVDTRLYVINGVHGHLIFEVGLTDANSVSMLNPGEAGKVISIRAEPLADPVESIANTDAYGNCHG